MPGPDDIRAAIAGADRGFHVITGGRDTPSPPDPPGVAPANACPVTCLGHLNGKFYFLDASGQLRDLSARSLGGRADLLSLFLGDDRWLREQFPKYRESGGDDGQAPEKIVVDFIIHRAAADFMKRCQRAGLYGDHLVFRRPGVWPGDDGNPVVHCGDRVRIGTDWVDAGARTGSTIWAAAAAVPRPALPCEAGVAQQLQQDLQTLFNWREPGGAVVTIGLLGTAYLAAAASWRSAGFLLGPAGCGKSTLLKIIRACCPMHWYSNDTSKAGLEQGLNGRAMPCLLDETEKSGDQRGAQTLLDLVLTASGDGGTQGARGGIDGVGRRIEVVGSIIMAATSPPEMRETHLGRFALIHLNKPEAGEDFRYQHAKLAEDMKQAGPMMWGRALAALARYRASLTVFRDALRCHDCAPREMDQLGAILAGWWILTHEGVPNEKGAAEGVGAISGFVRTAEIVAQESNAATLLKTLLSTAITLDRSSAHETIISLIRRIMRDSFTGSIEENVGPLVASRALGTHGVRVVGVNDTKSPRLGPCGIWINPGSRELRKLFENTDWAGTRWVTGLQELPLSRRASKSVRVGDMPCKAIWISGDDLGLADADDADWNESSGTDPPMN